MNLSTLALLALIPLLVWRIYARLKGAMARQRSHLARHWCGMAAFSALIVVAGSELLANPAGMAWLAIGSAAGVAYGLWGLRLTRFDDTGPGREPTFTPNARLGVAVAMAFIARVMYVGVQLYADQGGAPRPPFSESPLTVLLLGLTAAYFATYSAGLLRWRRTRQAARDEA